MAHPYYHARSSARRFGGTEEDYLPFHEFMDHTKAHLADCRHRLFLHNTWGIFFTEKLLGKTFTRTSDKKKMPLRPILEQHVIEDFSCIPSLKQCLQGIPVQPVEKADDILAHCQHSSEIFGGAWQDYLPLHQALNAPRDILADNRSQRLLHNAWGIALLVRLLGETVVRPSDGIVVSVRPVLEEHVRRDLGGIPTLAESVAEISVEDWMYRAAKPLSATMSK